MRQPGDRAARQGRGGRRIPMRFTRYSSTRSCHRTSKHYPILRYLMPVTTRLSLVDDRRSVSSYPTSAPNEQIYPEPLSSKTPLTIRASSKAQYGWRLHSLDMHMISSISRRGNLHPRADNQSRCEPTEAMVEWGSCCERGCRGYIDLYFFRRLPYDC